MGKYRDDVWDRANNLIKKNRMLNICKSLQFYVPIILIGVYLLGYFFKTGNYNFNIAVTRYEFYTFLVAILIYIMIIERITKELEKTVKGEIDSFRNKMILRICDCKDSCNCKDELNLFMKNNGVKVI